MLKNSLSKVLVNLHRIPSSIWLIDNQVIDELSNLGMANRCNLGRSTSLLRNNAVQLSHTLHSIRWIRRSTGRHLTRQHSKREHVGRRTLLFSFDLHLGSPVHGGSDANDPSCRSSSSRANHMCTSEVADLGNSRAIDQHVLGLEIEVQHRRASVVMQVHECSSNIEQDRGHSVDRHRRTFARHLILGIQLVVKRSTLHELEHQVARLVVRRSIDSYAEEHDNVRVPNRCIDRTLLDKVSQHCLSLSGVERSSHGLHRDRIRSHEEQSLGCHWDRAIPHCSLDLTKSACSEARALIDGQPIEWYHPLLINLSRRA